MTKKKSPDLADTSDASIEGTTTTSVTSIPALSGITLTSARSGGDDDQQQENDEAAAATSAVETSHLEHPMTSFLLPHQDSQGEVLAPSSWSIQTEDVISIIDEVLRICYDGFLEDS